MCWSLCCAGGREEGVDGEDTHGAGHHHHRAECAGRDRLLRREDQEVCGHDVEMEADLMFCLYIFLVLSSPTVF